jgi:predicted nucleotidyltransferase
MIDIAGELLSIDQACRDYSVGAATIYRHLKAGRLRRFRGGLGDRRTYLNRGELESLMRVKSDTSFDMRIEMPGQVVVRGRWPGPSDNAQVPDDPVLKAVLDSYYGVAQLDETHWSVNWFHPERGLTCWYWGDQQLVFSVLDELADRTESAIEMPVDRTWRRPSEEGTGGSPDLEQLRSRKHEVLKIASRYGASNVRVFGSVARGDAQPNSDIDLLVDFERQRTALDLSGLILDLRELLGREVDVGEASALLEPMRSRVLGEAVRL